MNTITSGAASAISVATSRAATAAPAPTAGWSRRPPRPCPAPSGRRRTADRSTRAPSVRIVGQAGGAPRGRRPPGRAGRPASSAARSSGPGRLPTTSISVEDVVDRVAGPARSPSARQPSVVERLLHLAARHRAHAAQVLRQDQVGLDRGGSGRCPGRRSARRRPCTRGRDGRSRPADERPVLRQRGVGHDGLRDRVGRVVALVGHAHRASRPARARRRSRSPTAAARRSSRADSSGAALQPRGLLQQVAEVAERAAGLRAVHEPVVERQRQRAGGPRLDRLRPPPARAARSARAPGSRPGADR